MSDMLPIHPGLDDPIPARRSSNSAASMTARAITTRRQPRGCALIRGEAIDRALPGWQRAASVALLVCSFLGTIAAFHGGWSPILALHLNPIAALGGIGLQSWCLAFELFNRRNKLSAWYIHALVLDVVPTFVGFLPVFAWFTSTILGLFGALPTRLESIHLVGYTGSQIVVAVVGAALSVSMALIPETKLID